VGHHKRNNNGGGDMGMVRGGKIASPRVGWYWAKSGGNCLRERGGAIRKNKGGGKLRSGRSNVVRTFKGPTGVSCGLTI